MNAGQKSARRIATSNGTLSRDTICTTCLYRLSYQSRRSAATAAAVSSSEPSAQSQETTATKPPATSTAPAKAYKLLASTVLSRPPLLTRELTSFEKAYYLYQKRLNERLAMPFSRYFYYKKGTPGDDEWKRKIRNRKAPARDVGAYAAYSKEGWNDEVLVGDQTAEPQNVVEALIRDAEGKPVVEEKTVDGAEKSEEAVAGDPQATEGAMRELQKVEVEKPLPRRTPADEANDQRSLSRKLDRVLYLLVKNKEGRWRFPEDRVYGKENLHEASERILIQSAGINMNTLIIANHPIGYHAYTYQKPALTKLIANRLVPTSSKSRAGEEGTMREEFGEKVFFMKARIMAGQADLSKNEFDDQEFRWLAKEEVEQVVSKPYWSSIRNMLTER